MEIQMLAALSQPNDAMKDVIIPLVSGLGGAVVGAVVSYFTASRLAKQTSAEVLERDKAARRDNDVRAAHQVFVKLSVIANSLCGYHKQVEEMIAKADADGNAKILISEKLSTFAGIERASPVEFSPDELSIYIAGKQQDYMNNLLLLARHHEIHISHLITFAKLKAALHEEIAAIGVTTRDESGMSRTRIPNMHPRYNLVMTKRDELEIYTKSMRTLLAEGDKLARRVTEQFNRATEAYLGEGSMPDFEEVKSN
jgi:hypothetical protein